MLPEPTLPKRRRAAPGSATQPQPGAMTPLFAVPDSPDMIPPPGGRIRGRPRAAGGLIRIRLAPVIPVIPLSRAKSRPIC